MGIHGSGSHSPDERVDLTSPAPTIKRAALLIHRLSYMPAGPMVSGG